MAPPSTRTHTELNDNPRSLGSSQDRRGRTIGGISLCNRAPQNSLVGEREAGGELTQAGIYNINCILDCIKSISPALLYKGERGCAHTLPPPCGTKERQRKGGGRGVRPAQVRIGLGLCPFHQIWCGSPSWALSGPFRWVAHFSPFLINIKLI